jgi:hypothetical protein
MRSWIRGIALCLVWLLSPPVFANDSEAEIALGGLTLKHSDAISMDSEDLFVSRNRVRVRYRFTNTSDAPIETLVAFPLPDIPPAQEDESGNWADPGRLNFKTTVDGKPIAFEIIEQAMFKDADISARLKALNIPLNRMSERFVASINALSKADRDRLVADGLMRDDGGGDQHVWSALWSLRLNVTRTQVFPAKATVSVEHEYTPLAGGSVGGQFDPQYRGGDNAKYFAQTRRKYCIEDDWLKSFDAKFKNRKRSDATAYSEIWLGYVLKTGANWKWPIKDFRLVVDKGKPDSLVSFCAEGVKKISPTQFESRRKNFAPDRDLDVLILDWAR